MHILITGGTGFIGSHLIQAFSGHTVTLLTRNKAKAAKLLSHSNIILIQSLSELENLNHIDAVVNLAGEAISQRWSASKKAIIRQSRLETTQKIVDLIRLSSRPPACLISGSAIGIYGDQGERVICDTPTDKLALNADKNSFTEQLCKQWESIAMQASNMTRVCIIRTGIVLGRSINKNPMGILKVLMPLFKFGLGGRAGNGKQFMSWIHIDDMVSAILFLLNHQQGKGVFNLCAPNAVTNERFGRALAKTLNRPFILHTPAWLLRLVLGEASALVLDSVDAKPSHLESLGFDFLYSDLEFALAEIKADA